jgi:hypothetical protein
VEFQDVYLKALTFEKTDLKRTLLAAEFLDAKTVRP